MLIQARRIQDLPSWPRFPLPQPELERDRLGFARYFDNHDGCSLPPNWLAHGDEEYTQLVSDIKSHETFHTHFQVWESQYRDPRFLSKLTLGQFGSQVELELHDWLHMRWASVARDPASRCRWHVARMILPSAGSSRKTTFSPTRFHRT